MKNSKETGITGDENGVTLMINDLSEEDSSIVKENLKTDVELLSIEDIIERFREIEHQLNRSPDDLSYDGTLSDLLDCLNYVISGCETSNEHLEELCKETNNFEHSKLLEKVYDDFTQKSNDIMEGILELQSSYSFQSNGRIIKGCISKLFDCKVTLYELTHKRNIPLDIFNRLDSVMSQIEGILNEIMLTYKDGEGVYDRSDDYENHKKFLQRKENEFKSIKDNIKCLSNEFEEKINKGLDSYDKKTFKVFRKILTKLISMYDHFDVLFLTECERFEIIEREWYNFSREIYTGEVLDNYDLDELLEG